MYQYVNEAETIL